MKKRYDLIVIGSNIDALLSATYAGYLGMSVLVIEEQIEIGGINNTISKNKFNFDIASPFFTNLGTKEKPGLLLKTLNKLDITIDYHIDSNILTYFLDKPTEIRKIIQTLPFDESNFLINIEKIIPGSKKKVQDLLNIAYEFYQIKNEIFEFNFTNLELSQMKQKFPLAYKYLYYTTNDLLNEFKVSPELKRFLGAFTISFGQFNKDLPAWWFLSKFYEIINFGISTLTNGSEDLVSKLFKKSLNFGVDYILDTQIKNIVVHNNKVQAVETNRGPFLTNQIISTFQENYVLGNLIEKEKHPKSQLQNILVRKNNSQTLFFNLGLRCSLKELNLSSFLTYIYNDDDYDNLNEKNEKDTFDINNVLIKCLNFVDPKLNEQNLVILNLEMIYGGNFFLKRPAEMIFLDENYILNLVINFLSKTLNCDLKKYLDATFSITPIKIAHYTRNKSGIYLGKQLHWYNPFFLMLKNELNPSNIQGLHFANQDGIFGFTPSESALTSIFEVKLVEKELLKNKEKIQDIINEQKELIQIKKASIESNKETKELPILNSDEEINETAEISIVDEIAETKTFNLKKGQSLLDMENQVEHELNILDYYLTDNIKQKIIIEEDVVNTKVIEKIKEIEVKEQEKLEQQKAKIKKHKPKKVTKTNKFHTFVKRYSEFEEKYRAKDIYLIDASKRSINTVARFAACILDHSIEPIFTIANVKNAEKNTINNDIAIVIINASRVVFGSKHKWKIPTNKREMHFSKLRAKKPDVLLNQTILSILLNHKYKENKNFIDNIHIFKNSEHIFKQFSPKLLTIPKRNISYKKINDFVYMVYPPSDSIDDLIIKTKKWRSIKNYKSIKFKKELPNKKLNLRSIKKINNIGEDVTTKEGK